MKIDPREMTGRRFDSLGYVPTDYVEEHRDWHADEGIEPDWTVELRDESMEFLLTEQRTIATIFVRSEQLISEIVGAPARTATVRDVLAKYGNATTFGPEADIPILGRKGPWLRYDSPHQVMHLEFAVGGFGIHMLTLMAPEHAP